MPAQGNLLAHGGKSFPSLAPFWLYYLKAVPDPAPRHLVSLVFSTTKLSVQALIPLFGRRSGRPIANSFK